MDASTQMQLAKLLSLVGLIGATIEYAEIIKRRARFPRAVQRTWFDADPMREVVRAAQAPPRSRATGSSRANQVAADIGWAAVGLIGLVIRGVLIAWRSVRP